MTDALGIKAPQLDTKTLEFVHPIYKRTRVVPLSGSQTSIITQAGGNDVMFELPVNVMNLSRSYLQFTLTPAANAAVRYWAWKDCLAPIREIHLYNRNKVRPIELYDVANYTKVVWKPETSLDDFLTQDTFSNDVGQAGYFCRLNAAVAAGQRPQDGSSSNVNYTEPQYTEVGTGANATPSYNVVIPLSAFNNTWFQVDKDIYWNEVMIVRIVWNASNRIIWNSSAGAPNANTATAYIDDMKVSNLQIMLANEENAMIANSIINKTLNEGITYKLPFVHTFKTNLGPSGSQTVSIRFNSGHGKRLRRIYHAIFNGNETVNIAFDSTGAGNTTHSPTAYDHDNRPYAATLGYAVARPKVIEFYTALNGKRINEYNIVSANYDDYNLIKDKLRGTVIQNSDMYYYNWFWIDDFDGFTNDTPNKDNLTTGLDLSIEQKWEFFGVRMNTYAATAADLASSAQVNNSNRGQYNHYTFAIVDKFMTVSKLGLTVD